LSDGGDGADVDGRVELVCLGGGCGGWGGAGGVGGRGGGGAWLKLVPSPIGRPRPRTWPVAEAPILCTLYILRPVQQSSDLGWQPVEVTIASRPLNHSPVLDYERGGGGEAAPTVPLLEGGGERGGSYYI
jgi:hypothetical protein